MSLNEEVEVLRGVPLFARIDPAKLKLLAFTSERLVFPPRSELFRQGDPGDAAYIILDGEADVLVDSPEGGEIVVAEVRRNDFVGEIAILIDVPRTATVRAKTDLSTLVVTKEAFLGMAVDFPDVAIEIMRELAQRLADTTAQLTAARAAAQAGSGPGG